MRLDQWLNSHSFAVSFGGSLAILIKGEDWSLLNLGLTVLTFLGMCFTWAQENEHHHELHRLLDEHHSEEPGHDH